jgi:outer membrane protein assembly factor BamA
LQLIANIIDFRFPLFWWFQGALFLDAGYVWEENEILNTPFSELMGQVRWGAVSACV